MVAESSQPVLDWSYVQAVQLIIDAQEAVIQQSYKSPYAIYQYELAGKPRMRVMKIASSCAARPGEVVDFLIRFDNIGTQRTENVTIVDNLTPRLEYIPETAQCSLPAKFSTQPNEGDSLVLRWEITAPCLPGQGGVVRFRCRVR